MVTIAYIHNDFDTKFGVPRQSGLVPKLHSTIVFEPPYRNPESLRGIEGFSHIWLLWHFSNVHTDHFSPTVRPPRLGGNKRMGVFATRSPFRPNGIGLSSVRLTNVELVSPLGPILHVEGADLMNNTPILDIKPYLAYTDGHPDAKCGFTDIVATKDLLQVNIPEEMTDIFTHDQLEALREILANDPRPQYHDNHTHIYIMVYAGYEVRFLVNGKTLSVIDISKHGKV